MGLGQPYGDFDFNLVLGEGTLQLSRFKYFDDIFASRFDLGDRDGKMGKEEQDEEREVLASIFPDEITGPFPFRPQFS